MFPTGQVAAAAHFARGLHEAARQKAARLFAENLRRYLGGQPLLNVVDRARGY